MAQKSDPQAQSFTIVKQSDGFLGCSSVIYPALSTTRREIRLLHLEPNSFHTEIISGHVVTVSLDDNPEYEAVSYVWGDLTRTKPIKLHGLDYAVTLNQWTVLRRLRRDTAVRLLWLDAICINQADVVERQQQVIRMSEIYAQSQRTLIWLGEGDKVGTEVSDLEWEAMQQCFNDSSDISILEQLSNFSATRELVEDMQTLMSGEDGNIRGALHILRLLGQDRHTNELPFYMRDNNGEIRLSRHWFDALQILHCIVLHPWWSRVWIIPEAVLSPRMAQVMVGSLTEPLETFFNAEMSVEKHDYSPGCCHEYAFRWGRSVGYWGYGLRAFAKLRFIFESESSTTLFLGDALDVSCYCSTSDPRDHIYGVLGLVKQEQRVQVSYTVGLPELYSDVTLAIANTLQDINWVLSLAVCQQKSPLNLPTWCRDFSQGILITAKHAALALCRRLQEETKAQPSQILDQISPGVLQVHGEYVDTIVYAWDTMYIEPHIPLHKKLVRRIDEWWDIWSSYDELLNRHSFWKILLWDLWVEDLNSSAPVHPLPVDVAVSDRIHSDIMALGNDGPNTTDNLQPLYTEVYKRAFEDYRPLLTRNGHVGSGPVEVWEEDQIYRLKGCPLPVVLRQVKDCVTADGVPQSPNHACFKLVGLCYISECVGSDRSEGTGMDMIGLV